MSLPNLAFIRSLTLPLLWLLKLSMGEVKYCNLPNNLDCVGFHEPLGARAQYKACILDIGPADSKPLCYTDFLFAVLIEARSDFNWEATSSCYQGPCFCTCWCLENNCNSANNFKALYKKHCPNVSKQIEECNQGTLHVFNKDDNIIKVFTTQRTTETTVSVQADDLITSTERRVVMTTEEAALGNNEELVANGGGQHPTLSVPAFVLLLSGSFLALVVIVYSFTYFLAWSCRAQV